MLLSLKLENLVLIEKAQIAFGSGLNILTGETGAGKSVLLAAIRLISGEKGGADWIRHDAASAVVEAEIFPYPTLPEELEAPPPGEPLLIRRELFRSNKSRCLIQDNLVSASFLRSFIRPILEIVDQNSSQYLCESESQRKMLDAFADLEPSVLEFSRSFDEEMQLRKQLNQALEANSRRKEDLAWAQTSLQQIEQSMPTLEEETQWHQELNRLSHAEELLIKVSAVTEGLSEFAPQLHRFSSLLEHAARLDPSLTALSQTMKASSIELEEIERSLLSSLQHYDTDPSRLAAIEEKITVWEQLKRRFGGSRETIEKQKGKFLRQIEQLEHLDEEIETLQNTLHQLEKRHQEIAGQISLRRKVAASTFANQVQEELQSLNLPYAQFEVSVQPTPISSYGIDTTQFRFSANPGFVTLPLNQCASGGELSRLLLAIKTVLAKTECQCLVFDEIDSNVGGQTAAMLGEKLKTLSKTRQVLCVTHFVQVAKAATDHFAVSKKECNDMVFTSIERLDKAMREKEFSRMLGIS